MPSTISRGDKLATTHRTVFDAQCRGVRSLDQPKSRDASAKKCRAGESHRDIQSPPTGQAGFVSPGPEKLTDSSLPTPQTACNHLAGRTHRSTRSVSHRNSRQVSKNLEHETPEAVVRRRGTLMLDAHKRQCAPRLWLWPAGSDGRRHRSVPSSTGVPPAHCSLVGNAAGVTPLRGPSRQVSKDHATRSLLRIGCNELSARGRADHDDYGFDHGQALAEGFLPKCSPRRIVLVREDWGGCRGMLCTNSIAEKYRASRPAPGTPHITEEASSILDPADAEQAGIQLHRVVCHTPRLRSGCTLLT